MGLHLQRTMALHLTPTAALARQCLMSSSRSSSSSSCTQAAAGTTAPPAIATDGGSNRGSSSGGTAGGGTAVSPVAPGADSGLALMKLLQRGAGRWL